MDILIILSFPIYEHCVTSFNQVFSFSQLCFVVLSSYILHVSLNSFLGIRYFDTVVNILKPFQKVEVQNKETP
jgi:hypothetical protein